VADVRRFSDAEIERLIKFYEQAEREILDRLNRALLRGNKTEYLEQMKKNIEAILQQLREGNRTWCTEAIPRVYTEGLKNADAMLKDAGVTLKAAFGAIHQQAAQVLAENTYQRLDDVVQVIGRQVNDIYRELALENVRGTVVGYDTWQQTARRFREQLAERGVTGFKDRSGRMWNMRTYTEMVARTTTMEAHLQGTANRLVEQGHDLVKVSTHLGACELCQPWQGKILSITGKTEGYPTMEEAKAEGLFHVNCRHAYGLYIDLDKEIEDKSVYDITEVDAEDIFTPAKTISEAEAYATDILGLKVNYKGMDLDTANSLNEGMFKTLKEFPQLKGFIEEFKISEAKTFYGKFSTEMIRLAPDQIKTKRILKFSNMGHKENIHEKLLASIEKDVKKNFHFKGITLQHIAAHELAHALEHQIVLNRLNKDVLSISEWNNFARTLNTSKEAKSITDAALKNMGIDPAGREAYEAYKGLGKYALENRSDLMAQAVADALISDEPLQFSLEVLKEVKKRLGGVN